MAKFILPFVSYLYYNNKYIQFSKYISKQCVFIVTILTNLEFVLGGSLPKKEMPFKRQYLGTIVLINGTYSSTHFKLVMDDPDANPTVELQDHFSDLFVLLFYLVLYSFITVTGFCAIIGFLYIFIRCFQNYKRHYLSRAAVNKLPTHKFKSGETNEFSETCAVCLEDFQENDKLRVLPCGHAYHTKCIDIWLIKTDSVCPQCRKRVFASNENLSGVVFGSSVRNYGSTSTLSSQSHTNLLSQDSSSTEDSSARSPLLGGELRQEYRFFRPVITIRRMDTTAPFAEYSRLENDTHNVFENVVTSGDDTLTRSSDQMSHESCRWDEIGNNSMQIRNTPQLELRDNRQSDCKRNKDRSSRSQKRISVGQPIHSKSESKEDSFGEDCLINLEESKTFDKNRLKLADNSEAFKTIPSQTSSASTPSSTQQQVNAESNCQTLSSFGPLSLRQSRQSRTREFNNIEIATTENDQNNEVV